VLVIHTKHLSLVFFFFGYRFMSNLHYDLERVSSCFLYMVIHLLIWEDCDE